MNLPLFTRIGGASTVEAAVNRFYQKFLDCEEIIVLFEGVNLRGQEKKLRQFFTIVLGGESNISYSRFIEIHKPLIKKGLKSKHVDMWLVLTEETLQELEIPSELIGEFMEMCEPYKEAIYSITESPESSPSD